jgi:ferrochelatase
MRYGRPSIATGLAELRRSNTKRIIILPLYPQYSATTVGTIFDDVFDVLKTWRWVPEIRTINDYHDHPLYIQALADCVRKFWQENGRSQRLILSFHGIPKEYAQKGDPYPVYCCQTAQHLAQVLDLDPDAWQMTFQSRFGPQEWLQPYTDKTLVAWGEAGVKSVDTICPGFAADCLETLEEMAQENRDIFLETGGQTYQYIPALNDSPAHATLLAELIRQHQKGWVY